VQGECDVDCTFVQIHALSDTADALLIHAPSFPSSNTYYEWLKKAKGFNIPTIFYSLETNPTAPFIEGYAKDADLTSVRCISITSYPPTKLKR